jgi:uncharacterized glyoxalase superfamily protein PhnB
MELSAMHVNQLGFVVLAHDVRAAAAFYTAHFGFRALVLLDWFASLQHPAHEQTFFDMVHVGHPAAGAQLRTAQTAGVLLALLVDDCDREYQRLQAAALPILMAPQDEPWGQRRCQIQAPDGVVVEVIQRIPLNAAWMQANT